MAEDDTSRKGLSKDEIRQDISSSRMERYYRTAHFVQSKWFILGGGLAIAIFLLIVFLVAS